MADDTTSQSGRAPAPPPVHPWLYPLTFVALFWLIVLLVIWSLNNGAVEKVISTVAGLAAVVSIAVGILPVRSRPLVFPRFTPVLVAAILAAEVVCTAWWAGSAVIDSWRDVSVISRATLQGNLDVLPDADVATLQVPITAGRGTLEVVFDVTDTHQGRGFCRPYTVLSVTPQSLGNAQPIAARPGEPVVIELHSGITVMILHVRVSNTKKDRNCSVDVSVREAVLK